METELLLVGLAMAVGLVGVIVPLVPGLLLVALAGVAWAWWDGDGAAWAVTTVMLVLLGAGTVAKYALPGRTLRGAGAPWSTLVLGAVGAVVGFFVIPVLGLIVGGVAGVWLGEWRRLRSGSGAWRSTWATIKGIGLGILLELTAGVVAVAVWAVAVLLLHP